MRSLAWALVVGAVLAGTSGRESSSRVINVANPDELISALHAPLEDVTIQIAPGRYVLPGMDEHPGLGPCNSYATNDPVRVGVVVSGRRVRLVGSGVEATVIVSDAYFRIWFKDCADCELEHVAITGNDVDRSIAGDLIAGSTMAGVLITKSRVRIANCVMKEDSATGLEGAGEVVRGTRPANGVVGWKDAELTIEFNEFSRNFSAISLRENTHAAIRNNLIEGSGASDKIGNEAIDLMCDATATVERNHFRGLTGGFYLGDTSSLIMKENIVEDVYYAGISMAGAYFTSPWSDKNIPDPGGKLGRVRIEQNVIYNCGNAGIAVRTNGDQTATRNIIVATGRIKPPVSAIIAYGADAEAAVRKNTLYDNTVTNPALDRDVPREAFWRARRAWTRTYRNTPVGVDGRHKFYESAFLTRYGRWAD
ncbi:MAG TPA: right-handed parallel beta-helix repeat-containing protein [Candidatus Krumholzibacteria bacterium]|nr:right-handed parallel beta-helix repeat-containing protein [Candidatus Krumholzibacteria bacterium]